MLDQKSTDIYHGRVRHFHDALLSNGALPLAMVEAEIDRYIALTKNKKFDDGMPV